MSFIDDVKAIEDAIQQEHLDDCMQDHSPTGLCPCCGVELEEVEVEKWTGRYMNVLIIESQQTCPSCEWTSAYFYDA